MSTISLQHNRITLALHHVKDAEGPALLLLHGLGESATNMATLPLSWNGPIWALDFTGHGESTVPRGGGYSAEILMADVDVALRHIGPATIVGRGLGGYIAFLIAGARPQLVRGVVILDGPGLAGGAVHATSSSEIAITARTGTTPDPWALIELSRDARPPNYAVTFVQLARNGSTLDEPIAVTCKVSPPWIEAIRAEAGVMTDISMQDALDIYAAT
ncbi:MAG: alpha/beta fold hydrolase [Ilumatobacteraceae bacterium]